MVALAFCGVCAAVLVVWLGYSFAQQNDQRGADERRAALRAAIGEFRAVFGDGNGVDPRFVRMVEQSTSLKDLKFESEPSGDGREMQPVLDGQGRIAGFLTWQPDFPMTATVSRLLPVLAFGAFGLVVFAGYSLVQLRRARLALSASESEARRAAEEDALTGLPNRRKMLAVAQGDDGGAYRRQADDVRHVRTVRSARYR